MHPITPQPIERSITEQPTDRVTEYRKANATAFGSSFGKGLLCIVGGFLLEMKTAPYIFSSMVSSLASSALFAYVWNDTLSSNSSTKGEDFYSKAGLTVITAVYVYNSTFPALVRDLSILGTLYLAKSCAREGSYLHAVFHAPQIAKQSAHLKEQNAQLNALLTTPEEQVRAQNLTLQQLLEKERAQSQEQGQTAASNNQIINLLQRDKETLQRDLEIQKTMTSSLQEQLRNEKSKPFFARMFG